MSYAAQQQPLAGSSSKFIAKIDEDLKLGCLTTSEIILKNLVCYLIINGIEVSESNLYNIYQEVESIFNLYNGIAFPMFARHCSDIKKFLKKLYVQLEFYFRLI